MVRCDVWEVKRRSWGGVKKAYCGFTPSLQFKPQASRCPPGLWFHVSVTKNLYPSPPTVIVISALSSNSRRGAGIGQGPGRTFHQIPRWRGLIHSLQFSAVWDGLGYTELPNFPALREWAMLQGTGWVWESCRKVSEVLFFSFKSSVFCKTRAALAQS